MGNKKYIGILAILLLGLMVSGCASDDSMDVTEEETSDNVADEILAEEGVVVTDSELEDLENDLDDFDSMISEL